MAVITIAGRLRVLVSWTQNLRTGNGCQTAEVALCMTVMVIPKHFVFCMVFCMQ